MFCLQILLGIDEYIITFELYMSANIIYLLYNKYMYELIHTYICCKVNK